MRGGPPAGTIARGETAVGGGAAIARGGFSGAGEGGTLAGTHIAWADAWPPGLPGVAARVDRDTVADTSNKASPGPRAVTARHVNQATDDRRRCGDRNRGNKGKYQGNTLRPECRSSGR
jgi:hypothetical protein